MPFIRMLDRYDAFLYPNEGKQSGRLNLYCDDHKLYLLFLDPEDALPANSFDDAAKIGRGYQRFSQYRHFLDLVRNERPVWVTFIPEDTPSTFVVFCGAETPGEGEM